MHLNWQCHQQDDILWIIFYTTYKQQKIQSLSPKQDDMAHLTLNINLTMTPSRQLSERRNHQQ